MTIHLEAITQQNYLEAINLEVSENQKQYVAPNVFSLAQAKVFTQWRVFGIYSDCLMVGFTMFGIDPDDDNVWIIRMMIDHRYQRKGYGKTALKLLLERIEHDYPNNTFVLLSTEPENKVAQSLYEKIGFKNTGEFIEGEVVFKLDF